MFDRVISGLALFFGGAAMMANLSSLLPTATSYQGSWGKVSFILLFVICAFVMLIDDRR